MSNSSEQRPIIATQKLYFDGQNGHGSLARRLGVLGTNLSLGSVPHLGSGIVYDELVKGGLPRPEIIDLVTKTGQVRRGIEEGRPAFISVMDIGIDVLPALLSGVDTTRVMLGGYGPTYSIELVRERCNGASVFIGRAEGELRFVARDLADGRLKGELVRRQRPFSYSNTESSGDSFRQDPFFNRSLIKPVEVTAGCQYGCIFCHTGQSKERSVKPIGVAVDEIENMRLNPWNILFLVDQNLMTAPREYLMEFFGQINQRGIRWIGEGTVMDIIEDEDLLGVMAKNCVQMLVGVEDINEGVKGSASKRNLASDFERVVGRLRELKFPILWSLVVGLDGQDPTTIKGMTEEVKRLMITPVVHVATPRPGTPYWDSLKERGAITDNSSLSRDLRRKPVFRHPNFADGELFEEFQKLYADIFSAGEITRRFKNNAREGGFGYALRFLPSEAIGFSKAHEISG